MFPRMALTLIATILACSGLHAAPLVVHAIVHADQPGATVSRNLFGQFAEHLGFGIYGGIWVGEGSPIPNTRGYRNDVVAALRRLEVPVVRWPGGCFADEYHWREGVGPRAQRPVRVNTNWGGVEENNAFGTHEFLDFAELIGADAYVSGNVGDASPDEMAQWVEYITSDTHSTLAAERRRNGRDKPWKLAWFGIGNELWGCGGNMRAEYAADIFRRYQTFLKIPPGQATQKAASGANSDDYHWTDVMMSQAGKMMNGISVHYYTSPGRDWEHKLSSTDFGEDEWIETLSKTLYMEELITRHSAIMDKYDPDRKVALLVDEWGTWYRGLPGTNPGFLQQQDSLRDALVAALNFDIFSQHAERVRMANIAQMVNVLQSMIMTDGPRMVLTPTYHAFELYKTFRDSTHLPMDLDSPVYEHGGYRVPAVHGAAVRGKDGALHVALVNLQASEGADVVATIAGAPVHSVGGRVLTAAAIDTVNSFEHPEAVGPQPFSGARLVDGMLRVALPAHSVVMLDLR